MAYDETLAGDVRAALAQHDGVDERRMFGGLAFLLRGNMCCGVHGEELIVRLDPEDAERALDEPRARPMDLTGRPLRGFLFVDPAGLADGELERWVARATAFAASLPPKSPKGRAAGR